MSLDAAYGDGTMQELHRANADSDYGHGKGDEGAQTLQQVPHKPDATPGFSQLPPHAAPAPPGRHAVAQFPQAPPPPPLPAMPQPQGMARGGAPPPHMLPQMPPMPAPQHARPMQQPPLLRDDDRFSRVQAGQKKGGRVLQSGATPPVYDGNGMEIKEKKSFYENYKVLIIVFIVIICLVLGILVAVVVAQKKKSKLAELSGGFDGAGVPQYVGGMDFGNHFSSLPQRAWNESASVYVRR